MFWFGIQLVLDAEINNPFEQVHIQEIFAFLDVLSLIIKSLLLQERALNFPPKREGQTTVCYVSAFRDQDEMFPVVAEAEQLPPLQLVSLIVKGQ